MSSVPTFLRPIDRLYFGPPRGQSAGEIHGGRSEFPPSPHTVAGIVRTHLLRDAERRGALAHALGDTSEAARRARIALVGTRDDLPDGWQLGPTLPAAPRSHGGGALMPWLATPRCLAWPAGAGAVFLREVPWPDSRRPILSDDASSRRAWFAAPPGPQRDQAPAWVAADDLHELLRGRVPADLGRGVEELPPFVHRERWAGLAVEDASRRAHDGLLYTLDMLRFEHGGGLLTWADLPAGGGIDPAALAGGVARAGSKAHLVQLAAAAVDGAWRELCATPHFDHAPGTAETSALVYLATPSHLRDHRDPVPALRAAQPTGLTITTRAAFVGDPLSIGGLDSVSMTPLDNRQHVAPGSCWFVTVAGGSAADRAQWLQSLHASHALAEPRAAAFGYGLTFVAPLPLAAIEGASHVRS